MLNKKIYLKALPKKGFGQFSLFSKCKETLICSPGNGGWKTGLTEEEQTKLEKALQLPEKTLGKFNDSYWNTWGYHIMGPIKNEGNIIATLDLSNPNDFLTYKVLSNNKYVMGNPEDFKAKARFILQDTEREAEVSNVKFKRKAKAMEVLSNSTPEQLKDILKMFGKNGDTLKESIVQNELYNYIEESAEKFLEAAELAKNKTRVLVESLKLYNVIRRTSGKGFTYGDLQLGQSMEEVVEYLDNPDNDGLKASMIGKLKAYEVVRN